MRLDSSMNGMYFVDLGDFPMFYPFLNWSFGGRSASMLTLQSKYEIYKDAAVKS